MTQHRRTALKSLVVGVFLVAALLIPASAALAKAPAAAPAGALAVSTSCSWGEWGISPGYVSGYGVGGGLLWADEFIDFAANCSQWFGVLTAWEADVSGNTKRNCLAGITFAHHDWYLTADQGGSQWSPITGYCGGYTLEEITSTHTAFTAAGIGMTNCNRNSVCGQGFDAFMAKLTRTWQNVKSLVSGASFNVGGHSASAGVRG